MSDFYTFTLLYSGAFSSLPKNAAVELPCRIIGKKNEQQQNTDLSSNSSEYQQDPTGVVLGVWLKFGTPRGLRGPKFGDLGVFWGCFTPNFRGSGEVLRQHR